MLLNEHSAVVTKEGVFYLLGCKGASMKLLHRFRCLELWHSGKNTILLVIVEEKYRGFLLKSIFG